MRRPALDDPPLFADDQMLGSALLGLRRANEWANIALIYDGRGFPRIDPVMGGRCIPAVRAFFDREYGIGASALGVPDGIEQPWKESRRRV
jgi:hypothetical protein